MPRRSVAASFARFQTALNAASSFANHIPGTIDARCACSRLERCRNYKPNGIKVLRCFPHCCPDHIPHSSCGTSVVMQVAGHFTVAEMESVVAFGRFETCVEPSLPLGYQLLLEEVAAAKHVWFPSTPSTDLNQNPIMFTFKDKLSDPWHYGWASGASSALRTTQHAFKAYLFEMVPGTRMIQVVGIAQSPGFIIIPYKPLGAGDAEPDATDEQQETTGPQDAAAFDCTFVACQCEKPMFGDNYIRYKVSRSLWTSLVFQQMQPCEWKKATEVGVDQGCRWKTFVDAFLTAARITFCTAAVVVLS
ncbi:hypothetical protein AC1031_007602 [Aphanomyces cochlioides]|nr:hypothetical protein AC1031_007602 [Aphanomyces cochlioides]